MPSLDTSANRFRLSAIEQRSNFFPPVPYALPQVSPKKSHHPCFRLEGRFAGQVKADFAVGQRVGIEHTPTIYVVSSKAYGKPFVEVVDRSKLYSIIDQMKSEADASGASAGKAAKPTKVAKK